MALPISQMRLQMLLSAAFLSPDRNGRYLRGQTSRSAPAANAFDFFVDLRVLSIFVLDHVVPWQSGPLRHGPVYPASCCAASRIGRRADRGRTARRGTASRRPRRAGRVGRPSGICAGLAGSVRGVADAAGIVARVKTAGRVGRTCDAVDGRRARAR
jgi:hypothetical protein